MIFSFFFSKHAYKPNGTNLSNVSTYTQNPSKQLHELLILHKNFFLVLKSMREFDILSFDGGGSRGVMEVMILKDVMKQEKY